MYDALGAGAQNLHFLKPQGEFAGPAVLKNMTRLSKCNRAHGRKKKVEHCGIIFLLPFLKRTCPQLFSFLIFLPTESNSSNLGSLNLVKKKNPKLPKARNKLYT